jgi:hypothetical protein
MDDITRSCDLLHKVYTGCHGFKFTVQTRYTGEISCGILTVCHRDIRYIVSSYCVAAFTYANPDSFLTVHPLSKQTDRSILAK